MSQWRVAWSDAAQADLARLDQYLRARSERAAAAAMAAIFKGLLPISEFPGSGRPATNSPPNIRDWPIPYGAGGYVVRYRIDDEAVTILAVRHMREDRF